MKRQIVWNLAAQVTGIVLPPLVLIALARLLAPADFGVFTLVTMVLAVVQGVCIAPLGEVVVRADEEDAADFVFSAQMLLGLLWGVVLFGLAGPLAALFEAPELVGALRVSLLLLIIMPVTETAIRVSMRRMAFRTVFIRRLVTPLANACVSIPLAMNGAGYWALVWGQIAGFAVMGALLLGLGGWRPRWTFDLGRFRGEIAFSGHMVAMGLVKWIRNQSDRAILAPQITSTALGQYDMARRLAGMPIQVLVDTVAQVLYSVMSAKARRGEDITELFLLAQRRLLMIAAPLALVMALGAEPIVGFVLGEAWLEITPLFRVLSLLGIWSALVGANLEVFKAMGQPGIMTRFAIVRAIATLVVFAVLAPMGIMALVWGVLGLAVVFSPINMHLTLRLLGIRWGAYIAGSLGRPFLVVAGVILIHGLAMAAFPEAAGVAIGLSLIFIAGMLFAFERDMLKRETP